MVMLLVMVMFSLVDISGEKEILFPEISALALGFWVMTKSPWECSGFAMWASPTLAALSGVLLLRYLPVPLFFLVGCAFVLVVLQLKLLRSTVFPSISAAILPLITGTTEWLYPVSVGVLMAVIVVGKQFLDTVSSGKKVAERVPVDDRSAAGQRLLPECVYWGKLLAGVLAVTALALRFQCLFMIAPPLIVAFVEISRPDQRLRQTPFKAVLLLVLAACVGILWLHLVGAVFRGPLWLFSGLALATVFLLFGVLRVSFPPAAALSLLPALMPAGSLWMYPLHVLLGSTLFTLLGTWHFRDAMVESPVPVVQQKANG
jgi:hypothetical protein